MSILIKGMEMPTDCHNCPLGFGGGCYCGTSADEYMCPDHGRAEWCPLVPVPPHGDLIDRRETIIDANERAYDFWLSDDEVNATIQFLKEQTTIIPAEEGERQEPT